MKDKFPNAKFVEVESIEDKNGENQLHIKSSSKSGSADVRGDVPKPIGEGGEQGGRDVGSPEEIYNAKKKALDEELNQKLEDNKDRLDDIDEKGGTRTVRQKIYQEHSDAMVELEKQKMKGELDVQQKKQDKKTSISPVENIITNIKNATSASINKIGTAVKLGFIDSHESAEKLSIKEQHELTQKVADQAKKELSDAATFIDKLREKGKSPKEIIDFLLKNMDIGGEKSAISANTWQAIMDFVENHPNEKAKEIFNTESQPIETKDTDDNVSEDGGGNGTDGNDSVVHSENPQTVLTHRGLQEM